MQLQSATLKTANSTPSPTCNPLSSTSLISSTTAVSMAAGHSSRFLHPLRMHKVQE
ncbi:hypothetical protein DL98DRAFT_578252 [Cadophora sp. DSE1049]|nr:hypothetical protein DL98DRAFT_578252 [Cadophora sp. DSE1049]